MKKTLVLAVLAATSMAFSAVHAEEAQSPTEATNKSSVSQAELQKQKKDEVNADIQNKKMLAELGSKSKNSMSLSLSYNGGSLSKPFGKDRPNFSGEDSKVKAALGGSISYRRRLDKKSSLSLGVGVSVLQPFHPADKSAGQDKYTDKIDVSDPGISYSVSGKAGSLMMVNEVGASVITAQDERNIGLTSQIYYSNTLLGNLGKSGWQLGLASQIYTSTFDTKTGRNDVEIAGQDVTPYQTDLGVEFYPFLEYSFNDTYNFRTVFRQALFAHKRNLGNLSHMVRRSGSQSVGVGISVTRDVFLYPNFQFSTENLSFKYFTDKEKFLRVSTVGISATINMF